MRVLLNALIIIGLLCFTFISCNKNSIKSGIKGTITFNSKSIEGLQITTKPASSSILSDKNGSFEIQILTPSQYEVIAENDSLIGSVIVSVEKDVVTPCDILVKRKNSIETSNQTILNSSNVVGFTRNNQFSGDTLFYDDFSDGLKSFNYSGNWKVENGLLKVIEYQHGLIRTIFINTVTASNFEYTGKFMFKTKGYYDAGILYNKQSDNSYETISNGCISSSKNSIILWLGPDLYTNPKVDFRFEINTWYKFKLIKSGNNLRYFIDDREFFNEANLSISNGGFGLRIWNNGEVWFDDILVKRL